MELNWTTVALEIVNFLVLVWILKRFLYRPVLQVIERRRADIETTLNEAREREETAQQLREQFENRLAAWQQDKLAAREELQRELERLQGADDATLAAVDMHMDSWRHAPEAAGSLAYLLQPRLFADWEL